MQTRLTAQDERIIDQIRAVTPLYRESSVAAALEALRPHSVDLIPVVDGAFLIGALWAEDLREAVLSGQSVASPIETLVDTAPPVLRSSATRDETRAILTASRRPALIVTDPDGRYLGVVTVFDLFHHGGPLPRPALVGGMATPMGVYLTNGALRAGAQGVPLLLSGVAMTTMLLVGVIITAILERSLPSTTPNWVALAVINVAPMALFFLQVRLSPIAAIHGAEHMVVHAIERGEPLRVETVSRMPRVHPRCGTNLAVGALVFTALVQATWPWFQGAGALIALVATLAVWRPLGSLVQKYITTKQPRIKDIENAISAAEELLEKFRSSDRRTPTFGSRLLASGLPMILIGSALVFGIASLLAEPMGFGELISGSLV
jgi:CBS domain-containing protein